MAATSNSTALIKAADARPLLGLGRPWWNLCFVHGDQTKYYRQLYGKRRPIRTLAANSVTSDGSLKREPNRCGKCQSDNNAEDNNPEEQGGFSTTEQ